MFTTSTARTTTTLTTTFPPPRFRSLYSSRFGGKKKTTTRTRANSMMMDDEKRTIPQLETEDAFIKTINSEGVHVVEFVAGWCRKCKTLNGKMEYFAVEHPEVTFDKIDVNMVPQDFIKSQNVTKMPTVKIFVSGKSVYEKVGFETVREILDELSFRLKQLEEENTSKPAASK